VSEIYGAIKRSRTWTRAFPALALVAMTPSSWKLVENTMDDTTHRVTMIHEVMVPP